MGEKYPLWGKGVEPRGRDHSLTLQFWRARVPTLRQAVFQGVPGLVRGVSAVQSVPHTTAVVPTPGAQLGSLLTSRIRAPFQACLTLSLIFPLIISGTLFAWKAKR